MDSIFPYGGRWDWLLVTINQSQAGLKWWHDWPPQSHIASTVQVKRWCRVEDELGYIILSVYMLIWPWSHRNFHFNVGFNVKRTKKRKYDKKKWKNCSSILGCRLKRFAYYYLEIPHSTTLDDKKQHNSRKEIKSWKTRPDTDLLNAAAERERKRERGNGRCVHYFWNDTTFISKKKKNFLKLLPQIRTVWKIDGGAQLSVWRCAD